MPTLTQEQNKKVSEILSSRGNGDDIISSGFSVELRRDDVQCLRPGEWLNDEVLLSFNYLYFILFSLMLDVQCLVCLYILGD